MYWPPLAAQKLETPPCGIRLYYIDPPLETPPCAKPSGCPPSCGQDPRPCMIRLFVRFSIFSRTVFRSADFRRPATRRPDFCRSVFWTSIFADQDLCRSLSRLLGQTFADRLQTFADHVKSSKGTYRSTRIFNTLRDNSGVFRAVLSLFGSWFLESFHNKSFAFVFSWCPRFGSIFLAAL